MRCCGVSDPFQERCGSGEIIVARDDIVDQMGATVKESMEAALNRIITEVPLAVQPTVAEAWG